MGVTLYEPASLPPDEDRRARAIEASGALAVRHDPQLQALVEEARTIGPGSMAAVSIVYRDWQYLIAAAGLPGGAYSRRTSLCGHAIMDGGNLFCVPDAEADARFAGNPVVAEERLLRFYIGVPLRDDDGVALGTLCVFDPRPRPCPPRAETMRLCSLAAAVMNRLRVLRRDARTV